MTNIMRFARHWRYALSLMTINDHKCRARLSITDCRLSIFDCPIWTLPVAIASWKVFLWHLPVNFSKCIIISVGDEKTE
jgi:hypothetical protein